MKKLHDYKSTGKIMDKQEPHDALLLIVATFTGFCTILMLGMTVFILRKFGYRCPTVPCKKWNYRCCWRGCKCLITCGSFGIRCQLVVTFLVGFAMSALLHHNHTIKPTIRSQEGVKNKTIKNVVAFVTTTKFSLDEIEILTKVAQSLYPVRNDVIWILVSVTTEKDVTRKPESNESPLRMYKKSTNQTRKTEHLNNLKQKLTRFRVPFVLLENDPWKDSKSPRNEDKGFATGVQWAVENVPSGVLMLGRSRYTYHHRIFQEVKKTKIASAWPVGLWKIAGFSAPIWDTNKEALTGYFDGHFGSILRNEMLVELGGYAVRIEYLRQNPDIVKTMGNVVTRTGENEELQYLHIPIKDIQLLANKGSQILVWRTSSGDEYFPRFLPLLPSYTNSGNMLQLYQNYFNVMYDQIPVNTSYTDAIYNNMPVQ